LLLFNIPMQDISSLLRMILTNTRVN